MWSFVTDHYVWSSLIGLVGIVLTGLAVNANWATIRTHKSISALVVILLLLAGATTWAHFRINRRTAVAREEKLYRVQSQAEIAQLKQAMEEPENGILAKLAQINTNLGTYQAANDERVDKVENRVDRLDKGLTNLGTKVDQGNAKLLKAIKALGGHAAPVLAEPAEDAGEEAETPSEPHADARSVERPVAATPKVHAATKPAQRSVRAEPEPSEAPAAAAPAKSGPADEDALLAGARKEHSRIQRSFAAARAAHEAHRIAGEQVEALVDEVVGGEESLTPEDADAVEQHRRRYQPAAIRATSWRDVRPDETKIVHVNQ